MKVDKNITSVICDIERLIGNETYNPNSYNGWTCEVGCGFRYPVSYCKNKADLKDEKLLKSYSTISDIEPDCINTIKYRFGSNHLYIGNGIVEAMKFLEERYGLDFNELENKKLENEK